MVGRVELVDIKVLVGELKVVVVVEPAATIMKGFFFFFSLIFVWVGLWLEFNSNSFVHVALYYWVGEPLDIADMIL